MQIPIGHSNKDKNNLTNDYKILAGDIGGTKSNLAIFEVKNKKLHVVEERSFASKEFASFEEIIEIFYQEVASKVHTISLGIAGPVYKGKVKATNLPWELDAESIAERLGVKKVHLLNDLKANAYGIALLEAADLKVLFSGEEHPVGNAAVIAPGTGLGEAGMYWDGKELRPFATEGGHATFAPRDDLDIALLKYLQQKFGHVSWERVLSGPGLYNIFCFLVDQMNRKISASLNDEIRSAAQPSLVISRTAAAGDCEVCHEVVKLFFKYLGEESAHLCLKIKATGGLFVSGGIVPDVLTEPFENVFKEAFLKIGRMKPLLEKIPVKIIMNEKTPLIGAAFYGSLKLNNQ